MPKNFNISYAYYVKNAITTAISYCNNDQGKL